VTYLTNQAETGEFRRRYRWMLVIVGLAFGGIGLRLGYLQLLQGSHYSAESEDNFVRRIELPSTRGIIRDREGRVIADNRPTYDVYVIPQFLDRRRTLPRLVDYLDLTSEEAQALTKRVDGAKGRRRSQSILAREDVSRDQLAILETHKPELTGVQIVARPIRNYPFGELGAHVVGYMNEVTAEELDELAKRGYRAGERVGRTGVERAWESYLRGQRGWEKFVVGANGLRTTNPSAGSITGAERLEPVPGLDLRLTVDMELQRIIDRAFRGLAAGAAVVVDVHTGQILASYSRPSFDLNQMTSGLTGAQARGLTEDLYRPLIDKTLYENYFPGSTFKIVSALAGLEEGIITPRDQVPCVGYHELGRRTFRCARAHGMVDLRQAIVQSCNVYFYRLAEAAGMDRVARFAFDLGFGRRTGIGLNAENPGFIPTREWYARHYPNAFRIGFTLNAAIGQGNTKVNLLQLVLAYAAVANGGSLWIPQIVESVNQPDGTVVQEFGPRLRRRIQVSPEHLALLRDALAGVVQDPSGTAYENRVTDVSVAGKTGTAQVSYTPHPGEDRRQAWYYNRDHAWFTGYAPAEDPQIALVVLVEHGGNGGRNAAPVAMRIASDYLRARTSTTPVEVLAQPSAPETRGRGGRTYRDGQSVPATTRPRERRR
jgi:penicillin-binding protein 2